MRKLLLLLSAVALAFASNAQVADLPNGYYRINNTLTDRYIHVRDNTGSIIPQQTTADMNAVRLFKGLENAISEPSSVLYIEKHDSKYDITAQATGIHQMINEYVSIIKSPYVENAYCAYGSNSGMVLYLNEAKDNTTDFESYLSTNDNKNRKNWYITPIDNATDNYFGITPTVSAGGKHYQPFYADFAFTFAGSGMKAYYISVVDEKYGVCVYRELSGTLPRATPMFIETSSTNAASNKFNLGGSATAPTDNKAKGVYFDLHQYKHDNFVKFDPATMRLLGVDASGRLAMVNRGANENGDVPRNTFYIKVASSAPAEMRLVTEAEYADILANPVEATAISLSSTSLALKIGETSTLTATVTPAAATDPVEWSTSDAAVATVSAGKVTAVGIGTATITATCGKVSATCKVTVTGIAVTSVTLNATTLNLEAGHTAQLTATVAPDNATDKTVAWSSSNTAVATVDANGLVTAVSAGTATITAKCGNVSATCAVTVTAAVIPATGITLNYTTLNIHKGDTEQLIATIEPADCTDKTVTWSSSDKTKVLVDADGVVKGISYGSAVITATCGDVSATCEVTVSKPDVEASEVRLNKTAVTIEIAGTVQLTATVLPYDTTDKTVVWSSSDAAVATVDEAGLVTGVGEGTATITAACGDVKGECVVTVVNPDGIVDILVDGDEPFDVYTVDGVRVRTAVRSLEGLPAGLYIVAGHKLLLR